MAIYRRVKTFTYRDYTVIGEIGSGLSGRVYLAQHPDSGQLVAIKRLSRTADGLVRDFFLNEQRLLRKASHPHIVSYIEGGSHEQESFLVTQFIEGTQLDALVGIPLAPVAVVQIIEQLAKALDYLHQQHPDHPIIHCDVNPRNIIINEDGNVMLFDLSSSRTSFFAPAEDATMLSPRYCAPEQLAHQPSVQSDQYALAVIAFELLSGKPLFPNENKRNAYERSDKNGDPPSTHALTQMPATALVLNRALQRAPEERYTSCGLFAAQLERALRDDRFLSGEGQQALLNHIRQRVSSQRHMNRRHYAILVGLVALALGVPVTVQGIGGLGVGLAGGQSTFASVHVDSAATATLISVAQPFEESVSAPTATRVSIILPVAEATSTLAPTATPSEIPTFQPTSSATLQPTVAQPPTSTPVPPGVVLMPYLQEYGENQAKEILRNLDVQIGEIWVQYQDREKLGDAFDTYSAYAVVSTDPPPNSVIQPGSNIILGVRAP